MNEQNSSLTKEIVNYIFNTISSQKNNLHSTFVELENSDKCPLYSGYFSLSKTEAPKIFIYLLEIENDFIVVFKDERDIKIILCKLYDEYKIMNYNSNLSFALNTMQIAEFLFHFEKFLNNGVAFYPSENIELVIEVLNWALSE